MKIPYNLTIKHPRKEKKKITFILLDTNAVARLPIKTDIVRKSDRFSPTFPPAVRILTKMLL